MAIRKKSAPKSKSAVRDAQSHRRAIVFVSLVGVLTLTAGLLLALAPAPLQQERQTLLNQERITVPLNASRPSLETLPR